MMYFIVKCWKYFPNQWTRKRHRLLFITFLLIFLHIIIKAFEAFFAQIGLIYEFHFRIVKLCYKMFSVTKRALYCRGEMGWCVDSISFPKDLSSYTSTSNCHEMFPVLRVWLWFNACWKNKWEKQHGKFLKKRSIEKGLEL